ncbi:MAG: acyltransferase [Gammaproteobacteria bacterium]|nr:acyltransferase [Gammaproteobacteria bacterium]MDH5799264.1 acyltransferase [Gammaproteobacteria bacterium]
MAYLDKNAIKKMGFASVGDKVLISEKASFYNCSNIAIGSNVRIDDFCVFSAGNGGISIGNHIHIAVFSSLIGSGKIVLSDFCNLSSRVSVYSSTDDFSGGTMTSPVIPGRYKNVTHSEVYFGKHVIVGCGAVIIPGGILEDGVAVGALSLVNHRCNAFGVYAGVPARFVKERRKNLMILEEEFSASELQKR